jgi:hypothetical protein
LLVFVFVFFLTGVWTQNFTLTRQALYQLIHVSKPICCGYFWDKFFCSGQPGPWYSSFKVPTIPGMKVVSHHSQLFLKIGSHKLSCPGCPATTILLISASQVCRITGVSHQHPPWACFWDRVSIPFAQVGLKLLSSYFHCLGLSLFLFLVILQVVIRSLHS